MEIQNNQIIILNIDNTIIENNIKINYNLFENINNIDIKKKNNILCQILEQEKDNIILKYEIKYLINSNLNNFEEKLKQINLKQLVEYLFNRYSYHIGGHFFNFKQWKCRKQNKENYFIFDNIIHNDYYNDSDTLFFLENIQNLFNKIIKDNLPNYILTISSKFLKRDNMYIVFFIFVDKNI